MRSVAPRPGEHDPADFQRARSAADLERILDMIHAAVGTRMHGLPALSAAYAEIMGVQLDVVQRRKTVDPGR